MVFKVYCMSEAEWHLVRAGRPQLIGSHRRMTGDAFQFLPLFRTHREAAHYCQQSGLWCQNIRPRHNTFSTKQNTSHDDGLRFLLAQAAAEGVTVVGIFVGFNQSHESRWDIFGHLPKVYRHHFDFLRLNFFRRKMGHWKAGKNSG